MKKWLYILFVFLLIPSSVFAVDASTHRNLYPTTTNTYDLGSTSLIWRTINVYDAILYDDLTVTDDAAVGGDLSVTGTTTVTTLSIGSQTITSLNKTLQFNVMDFSLDNTIEITASTTPGYEEDNAIPSIVWANGETSPVMVTFRVPPDYVSGGAFRACLDESADGNSPVAIDFEVYVSTPGAAWDSSVTGQSIVARTEAAGTPEMVTLSVDTDFDALAAGDLVTLRVWREDTTQDTASDMELFYVEFYYD